MHTTASTRVTTWDRAAIAVLGLAGFLLSYDALRQTAAAIHVRGPLTYLFPLVIDGFIAYGVRALLMLRDAPLGARLYVWALFAAATVASLWANALHSVRLNQPGVHILILGNHTVAILSAIAPLALGGATHLHIIVTRHASHRGLELPAPTGAAAGNPAMTPADAPAIPAVHPDTVQAGAQPQSSGSRTERTESTGEPTQAAERDPAAHAHTDGQQPPTFDDRPGHADAGDSGRRHESTRRGRRAEASIEQLADIITQAYPGSGRLTRAMARNAIEARGLSAANGRIAKALKQLQRDETASPHPRTD